MYCTFSHHCIIGIPQHPSKPFSYQQLHMDLNKAQNHEATKCIPHLQIVPPGEVHDWGAVYRQVEQLVIHLLPQIIHFMYLSAYYNICWMPWLRYRIL